MVEPPLEDNIEMSPSSVSITRSTAKDLESEDTSRSFAKDSSLTERDTSIGGFPWGEAFGDSLEGAQVDPARHRANRDASEVGFVDSESDLNATLN